MQLWRGRFTLADAEALGLKILLNSGFNQAHTAAITPSDDSTMPTPPQRIGHCFLAKSSSDGYNARHKQQAKRPFSAPYLIGIKQSHAFIVPVFERDPFPKAINDTDTTM